MPAANNLGAKVQAGCIFANLAVAIFKNLLIYE